MQQTNSILSLFSGIGGIERGIAAAGCDHQFQVTHFVEANPYRRAVLARQYPHIPCHNDVRTFNSTQGQFSIIVGGSPCQGISGANTKGDRLDDDRSRLWYHMLRLINECRPQFVIWENVSSARRPKPGQPESVLGTVLRSLASIGFDAEWQTISAASLGAPHRRERIFVIAYPNGAFKSLDQVPHSWSRQIGADLALARDNSSGSSQHARTQGVADGTNKAGYTDITVKDGGQITNSPKQSAFLSAVFPIASTECKPLEIPAHHNREQSCGEESVTLPDFFSQEYRLEELAGDSPDYIPDTGCENITGEVDSMAVDVRVTPEVTVEVVEELLTEEELAERHHLELQVERAFCQAGVALRELRDRKLYRSTHQTFEEYCRQRFGFERRHPYRLIEAAAVMDNLCPNRTQNESSPSQKRILPTKLEQVRPLAALEPEQQREVWQQAVEQVEGKVPSGRIVKGIVERLKEKPLFKATDCCQVGDVFVLTRLGGAERKYNGCWAIAKSVNDFTVVVDVHDGILAVKPENLKPVDEPDARCQLPIILKRIRRLRESGLLDRGAYNVLEDLGQHTYLTEVEEGLLSWLEHHYGVN